MSGGGMTVSPQSTPAAAGPALARVLCFTDHSLAGAEAVRQAALLTAPGDRLDIVAVPPSRPAGMPRPQADQIEALVAARVIARDLGVRPDTRVVEAADEASGMLQPCAGHDLLVVPETAATVVAQSPIAVLVARPTPAGSSFMDSILVAVDGSGAAHDAACLAARLATRFGSLVALVATPEHDEVHREALQNDIAAVTAITGARPLVLDEQRAVEPSILGAAASTGATTIVLGSRPGTHTHSVSATLARDAACSVLVLRPATGVRPPRG